MEVFDDALLVAVDPTGKANEQELEGIHPATLSYLPAPDQTQTRDPDPPPALLYSNDSRVFGHFASACRSAVCWLAGVYKLFSGFCAIRA